MNLTIYWSLTESEYHVMETSTCEVTWPLGLFDDLQVPLPRLVALYCDNHSTLTTATNLVVLQGQMSSM